MAAGGQPFSRHRIAILRSLPEGEERLMTAGLGPPGGDGQHLFGRELGRIDSGRRLGERAVATFVPAEHCQRDEDLRRVGDTSAMGTIPDGPGLVDALSASSSSHSPVTLPGTAAIRGNPPEPGAAL